MGEGMASTVEGDIYETEIEAARAADDLAESIAEKEREHQEAEEQAREAEEQAREAEDLESALCSAE
jgi:hypothetical protein